MVIITPSPRETHLSRRTARRIDPARRLGSRPNIIAPQELNTVVEQTGDDAAVDRVDELELRLHRAAFSVRQLRRPRRIDCSAPIWRSRLSVSVTDQSSTIIPFSKRLIVMPLKRTWRRPLRPVTTKREVTRSPS